MHSYVIPGVTCYVPLYTVKALSTKQLYFTDTTQLYLSPKGNHSIVWDWISNLNTSKDLLLAITKAYTVFRTRQRLSVCHIWKLSSPTSWVLCAALITGRAARVIKGAAILWQYKKKKNIKKIGDFSIWWRESWGGNLKQAYKILKLVDKVNEELLFLKSCSATGNWEKNNLKQIITAAS